MQQIPFRSLEDDEAVRVPHAALAWTEALTPIAESRTPDEVYAEVRKEVRYAATETRTDFVGR